MNAYTFEELEVGQEERFSRTVTPEMEGAFRAITGDGNPLHWDDGFAREISGGKFDRHVTFGMLTASLYSTLAGVYLPGKYSLIHSVSDVSFRKPVFAGDVLEVSGVIAGKQDDLKLILVDARITNQNGQTVSRAKLRILVQR